MIAVKEGTARCFDGKEAPWAIELFPALQRPVNHRYIPLAYGRRLETLALKIDYDMMSAIFTSGWWRNKWNPIQN